MSKKFCIQKSQLVALRKQKSNHRTDEQSAKFDDISMHEKVSQMEKETGEFYEAMTADTAKFSKNTDNVEMMVSIDLSEFYFPDADAQICLEMKTDFKSPDILTWDNILEGFEKDTPIDCSVKSEDKQFNFQIKRYPQAYLPFTSKDISDYIKAIVAGYGDMTGIILIILLQPKNTPEGYFDFNEIHEQVKEIKNKISFDEINFIFNDENIQMIWRQIYPGNGHAKKPLIFESEKYQKIQLESKNKLEL
jgi:hypothetical protein